MKPRFFALPVLIFLLLSLSGLHGFSLPIWHEYLDGVSDRPREVLSGRMRVVRADDWRVTIPSALSQRHHEPKFPVVNRHINFGQNMLVVNGAPVLHPATLFRPTSWGYFLSDSIGVSWHWWTRVFSIVCAVFFVLRRIAPSHAVPSTLFFTMSPFIQYWSLNSGEIIGLTILFWFAVSEALAGRRPWLFGLISGWAAGCLLMTMYPPFVIVMFYAGGGIFLSLTKPKVAVSSIGAASIGLCVALLAAALFWNGASEALIAMSRTVYPGARVASGGDLSALQVFGNHALYHQSYDYHRSIGGNICESAGFLLFYPFLFGLLTVDAFFVAGMRLQVKKMLPLLIVAALLNGWMFLPLPSWVGTVTFMKLVPGNRALLGIGFADVCLLVWYLSASSAARSSSTWHRILRIGCVALWISFLWSVFSKIESVAPGFKGSEFAWRFAVVVLVSSLIAWGRYKFVVWILALMSAVSTAGFNPKVMGGTNVLQTNSLSEVFGEGDDPTLLIARNSVVLDAPRAFGKSVLGGAAVTPNFDFWCKLDPTGSYTDLYNRYALIRVGILPPKSALSMTLINPSEIMVNVPVDSPLFEHIVTETSDSASNELLQSSGWARRVQNPRWIRWEKAGEL